MHDRQGPSAGAFEGGVHVFPVRVYYEDTDAGGIVYYANYLKFAERARTEMMHLLDAGYREIIRDKGLAFAVRRCEVDFLAPARLDDVLEVRTRLLAERGASLSAEQTISREGRDIARLHVRLACINSAGKPARIPAGLRSRIRTLARG
jgi:acyl-CoA thioester hydrolase